MEPAELITYCGAYGGQCARWHGYDRFRKLARLLAEWVDARGLHHWMADAVSEFSYRDFRRGLDFFSRDDTWLVCRRCCRGGDGRPDCPIRVCCMQRGIELCFECDDFPCPLVRDNLPLMARAREYREVGRSGWLRRQVQRAADGYELHSGKYYDFRVSDSLSPGGEKATGDSASSGL